MLFGSESGPTRKWSTVNSILARVSLIERKEHSINKLSETGKKIWFNLFHSFPSFDDLNTQYALMSRVKNFI